MSTALTSLTNKLASKLDMGESSGSELIATLKQTAFKSEVSDAQMMALMVVANQYGLNPWTKEIYAYPDKQNGIVPVVGVDGWSRIMNNHPQFDGIEFEQTEEYCTCTIYRKDRGHPIKVTEFMDECKREVSFGPWKSHSKRMLRHKAMIQCARIAFGFAGIYDQDEAERISESSETRTVKDMGAAEIVEDVDMDVIEDEIANINDRETLNKYYKQRKSDKKYNHVFETITALCGERASQIDAAMTQQNEAENG